MGMDKVFLANDEASVLWYRKKVLIGGCEVADHLIWIDLEMTGLDPERHVILEIATIVTDNELRTVAEGPNIAINYPKDVLSSMEEWSLKHHRSSGLLNRVETSTYSCELAEKETISFLSTYCQEGQSPLCGNSVWQDRRFLLKYMPRLYSFSNYRNVDVSSIKELVKRWYPDLPLFKKKEAHLALSDIRESILEMQYYRQKVFR